MISSCLMIQGTTSDAGKSVMVAGICRVLKRKGIAVAPFKPQNMALNSAVTVDGGEIGRAQALQAQACGLPAHTDMNPVLLKPSSDTQAQVIIQGKALTDMNARNYHAYKTIAMEAVLSSFDNLSQQYQAQIVEGAGSPAEINLRDRDIANMGFAEAVDCPVVIVADIDKGGVFAHLVGTLALLSPSEQARVTGFIINRFRGDIALLQSGLDWLEERTGKKVWGVIPYLKNFYLDAEDAIHTAQAVSNQQSFKVVVPVFSRISNHTDFDALQLHPQVDLEFIPQGKALPPADLIILPGSKNVRKDLALLKNCSWQQDILKHLRYGGKLIGICGGYQMLGQEIEDSEGIEDSPGTSTGLCLLPMTTKLLPEKQLQQVSGTLHLPDSGIASLDIHGYEIHCGVTTLCSEVRTIISLSNGNKEGLVSEDNQVLGTYLHGLFDSPEAANGLLQWAGLAGQQAVDLDEIRESQLERLADCLEENLHTSFWQAWT